MTAHQGEVATRHLTSDSLLCLGVQADASRWLLDLDRSDALELLRDGSGVVLGDVFLERLGGTVDQVLGFLQTKRGDLAYGFDRSDFVCARILEDDGKLGLLLDRCGGCGTTAGGGCVRLRRRPPKPRDASSSFLTRADASSRLRLTI